MNTAAIGLSLVIFGGILLGGFTLPLKLTGRWPWETSWIVYSIFGFLIFPIAIAMLTLPPLPEIYARADVQSLVLAALYGLGWGIGSILFGIGVQRLGLSLGFSIPLGLNSALGALIPMAVLNPDQILAAKGICLLAGLLVVLAGIALCGMASGARDRDRASNNPPQTTPSGSQRTGLIICIVAGVLTCMLNLSIAFGEDIARQAVRLGAAGEDAPNAIWVLAVGSGGIANILYCLWLMMRNRGAAVAALFGKGTALNWAMGILMGAIWIGGINIYGRGAVMMGSWGAIIGWPLAMAMMIGSANVFGWIAGEWRGVARPVRSKMIAGLALLALGMAVIGAANVV